MPLTDQKTPSAPSPQDIARQTAGDREAAARHLIAKLRPARVIVAKKNGRTEIWVQQ